MDWESEILDFLPEDTYGDKIIDEDSDIPEGMIWFQRVEVSHDLKYELEAFYLNDIPFMISLHQESLPGINITYKIDVFIDESEIEKVEKIIRTKHIRTNEDDGIIRPDIKNEKLGCFSAIGIIVISVVIFLVIIAVLGFLVYFFG